MSVRIMTLAWAVELSAGDKLVLLALADCANDEGYCYPGLATLSTKTGKCRRSLQESLRALDAAGHITRDENPGKGMNYTVHPVAKSAPVAKTAPVAKSAATGGRNCHGGVAKSAPKPSGNHKEPSANQTRKHPLPLDWAPLPANPNTQTAKVIAGWPPGEFDAQAEQFKAHHLKIGSQWQDWQQAWITWVLNTRKFGIGRHDEQRGKSQAAFAILNGGL